ncbi:OTU domain-containing protein 1-like [Pecten maximus]|uniref:OTU domain-containing protein 1-like n=1 Tax=Pecten maximus TaxID=6579 RepID=UPI001458DAF3|nr:OTU domain-containing protein 1-like [Pecten maximus]
MSWRDPRRPRKGPIVDFDRPFDPEVAKASVAQKTPRQEEPPKEEDLGNKKQFYPVSKHWQKEKADMFKIDVKTYFKYGPRKSFYDKSPPKQTIPIRADGNCFFRAISAIITGSESDHLRVRELITKHISDHPDMYRTFLMSRGGMSEYLTNMRRPKEWATDVEILATATMLKSVVEVFFPCRIKGTTEYRWQTFKPLDNLDISHPAIYICNKNEHFEPVLDIDPTIGTSRERPRNFRGAAHGLDY